MYTSIRACVSDETIDKREIYNGKEYLEGVMGWDERGYFKVNKTELPFGSHSMSSFWN